MISLAGVKYHFSNALVLFKHREDPGDIKEKTEGLSSKTGHLF
jgi:hypothetical protein